MGKKVSHELFSIREIVKKSQPKRSRMKSEHSEITFLVLFFGNFSEYLASLLKKMYTEYSL